MNRLTALENEQLDLVADLNRTASNIQRSFGEAKAGAEQVAGEPLVLAAGVAVGFGMGELSGRSNDPTPSCNCNGNGGSKHDGRQLISRSLQSMAISLLVDTFLDDQQVE